MDGKHIAIQNPSGTNKEVFIYNKFYSIVLLAVVDANYKFVWLDISANGAAPEAQIWNTSELNFFLADGRLPVPPPQPLPFDNEPVPYHLISDKTFALKTSLVKLFGKRRLTRDEHIFN